MVYENVLASSFIYTLGVLAGKNASPNELIQDSINFFQQTPTDRIIGDLLADWGGKNFIVEFKRSIAEISDELEKDQRIELLSQLKSRNDMSEISEKVHFLGYGAHEKHDEKILTDIKFHQYQKVLLGDNLEETDFNTFLVRLQDSNSSYGGCSKKEFDNYLNFLIEFAEKPVNTTSSGGKYRNPIKGVLTSITDEGKVIMMEYSGYNNLMRQFNQTLNLGQILAQQIRFLKMPKLELSNKKSQNNTQSFSM